MVGGKKAQSGRAQPAAWSRHTRRQVTRRTGGGGAAPAATMGMIGMLDMLGVSGGSASQRDVFVNEPPNGRAAAPVQPWPKLDGPDPTQWVMDRPAGRKTGIDSHVGQLLGHNEPVAADESVAGGLDSFLALGGEWDIRHAGMPAVERPLRLAVTGNEDAGGRHNGAFA